VGGGGGVTKGVEVSGENSELRTQSEKWVKPLRY
jgi:hypothetical protein